MFKSIEKTVEHSKLIKAHRATSMQDCLARPSKKEIPRGELPRGIMQSNGLMKTVLILLLFLTSCVGTDHGKQIVKINNHLSVVTIPFPNVEYPKYKPGDSVIVWRGVQSDEFHIEHLDTHSTTTMNFVYYKGVIQ